MSELAIALEDLAAGVTLDPEQIALVRTYLDHLARG
jgi:hypothetical protein